MRSPKLPELVLTALLIAIPSPSLALSLITNRIAFDESDRANNLLGTFSANGTSSLALDNSALFLGDRSDTANISRLVFSSSISNRAFGINALSIATPSVPEPSDVIALNLVGLLGLTRQKPKFAD